MTTPESTIPSSMRNLDIGTALGLRGKVVAIAGAGGAKNGMGRAVAIQFAQLGSRVAALDIDAEALDGTVRSINAFSEFPATAWRLDVTDELRVSSVVAEIVDTFGRLDVWVHVAGGIRGTSLTEDTPVGQWRQTIELNLTGPFLCVRAVLPVLKRQGGGKIVLVSSTAARRIGFNAGPDYAAAKAALIKLTEQVAYEVGPFNINVNAIAPGPTHMPDEHRDRNEGRLSAVPLRRFSLPQDQARAIAFLASDWASMITGVTLEVNGGLLLGWPDYEKYLSIRRR